MDVMRNYDLTRINFNWNIRVTSISGGGPGGGGPLSRAEFVYSCNSVFVNLVSLMVGPPDNLARANPVPSARILCQSHTITRNY